MPDNQKSQLTNIIILDMGGDTQAFTDSVERITSPKVIDTPGGKAIGIIGSPRVHSRYWEGISLGDILHVTPLVDVWILGVPYTKREGAERRLMMHEAVALAVPRYIGDKQPRKRPKVNFVKEFELIQQKRSKLSKNDRDWVEEQFHLRYKQMEVKR